MKKWLFLSISMVMIHLIYPLCLLIAFLLGMEFVFYSQWVYELVVAVLFYAAMILRLVKQAPASVWDLLLIPAVLLGGMLLTMSGGKVSLLFMALNLLWAVIMTCRREGVGRFVVIALCTPAAYLMICWGIIGYAFSEWATEFDKLLYQVESPSGTYTAQVLEESSFHDQWITVYVVNNRQFTVLFGAFCHKPQHPPVGLIDPNEIPQLIWLDEDTLQIIWLDQDTQSVNSEVYQID